MARCFQDLAGVANSHGNIAVKTDPLPYSLHTVRSPPSKRQKLRLKDSPKLWDRKAPYYRLLPAPERRPTVHPPLRRSPSKRSNLTLVTLYDASFYEVANITAARMRRYAQVRGYRFIEHRCLLDKTREPAWNKILAVRQTLPACRTKWVMWVDADALIMNFDYRAEELIVEDFDLIFGSDFNGLNTSVFLVRNCKWCQRFLDTVYHLGEINYEPDRFGPKWEQNTIKHVLNNFTGLADHAALHPERHMNASPGVYRDGDFILHLGGMSQAERLQSLREFGVWET